MVESKLEALNAHFIPSQVKCTIKDKVALVEMNPPSKLIFLGRPIVEQLQQTFLALESDPEVNVVILTGKGNSFAVGADIKELE